MPKPAKWIDALALVFSLTVIALCVIWVLQSNFFALPLTQDDRLSWHLVRSAGITAYLLLVASMVWGMLVSSKLIRDWSPGVLSTTMHNTVSVLALVFSIIHMLLLLVDKYVTFTLPDILIPFIGPYRPAAVGLGIIAVWLIAVITISFPLQKRIGYRAWKWLHMSSYAVFGLVTLHALFAGTDSSLLGFRILIAASVLAVVTLLLLRLKGTPRQKQLQPKRPAKSKVFIGEMD
jgi:predicted ferric reductase